jgi:D-3-phosphoglycerate dehydrogenase
MQTWRILLLESLAEEAEAYLRSVSKVELAETEAGIQAFCANGPVHAILTRGKGQVTPALLDACEGLEVVARCGVGLDNVNISAATERKIQVINAPGSNSQTVAEHALSLMLMLQRQIFQMGLQVKAGNWEIRNSLPCDELSGKTLGILGMGNIGQRVAKLGEAFGMKVVFWDPYVKESPYESVAIHEALTRADLVSLHLPLVEDTQHLIGERELSLMKPSAYLINTARGGLIDEIALVEALQQGQINGFGADVLEVEPAEPDHPLLKMPQVLITPHMASLTATTYRNMCVLTAERVIASLEGRLTDTFAVVNRADL